MTPSMPRQQAIDTARPFIERLQASDMQEIFDQVVANLHKLLDLGTRSMDQQGASCVYRAHDGKRCAVGCLMTDAEYDPILEGWDIQSMTTYDYNEYEYMVEDAPVLALLSVLQGIHDEVPLDQWVDELKALAQRYELEYTPPGDAA